MYVKQLSVFIENREGRMEKVTETLAKNNVNIVCISLADTSEYGMLRMIVSDPEEGKRVLKEEGFSAMLTDVVGVKLPHYFGALNKLTREMSALGLNIEYMYAFTSGGDNASIIIKSSDNVKALDAVKNAGLSLVVPEEAYSL